MSEQAPPNPEPQEPKPTLLAQIAKGLSQIGLTFYVLLLLLALLATSGRDPRIAILMAGCALVPVVFGPNVYRLVGLAALAIAGAFYASSTPPPKRPGAQIPQTPPAIAVAHRPGRSHA